MSEQSRDNLTIRTAGLEDAEAVALLCKQLGYSATLEEARNRLHTIQADESHAIYVADLSGTVVGWIHAHACDVMVMARQALVLGIVVDEGERHRGIGRLLMQQVEAWAKEKNCEAVLARSNIIRQEAHIFYQKIGYQKTKQSLVFSKTLS